MDLNEIGQHYLEIITDPAHTLVEATFVLIEVLIIDVVRRKITQHFHRDIAREHESLDAEHGVAHWNGVDIPRPAELEPISPTETVREWLDRHG